jgi:hypothetical protein
MLLDRKSADQLRGRVLGPERPGIEEPSDGHRRLCEKEVAADAAG